MPGKNGLTFEISKGPEQVQGDEFVAVLNQDGNVDFELRSLATKSENGLNRMIGMSILLVGDKVLCQVRANNPKKELPGAITTAAGHMNTEDIIDGVLDPAHAIERELNEEVIQGSGIIPKEDDIIGQDFIQFQSVVPTPSSESLTRKLVIARRYKVSEDFAEQIIQKYSGVDSEKEHHYEFRTPQELEILFQADDNDAEDYLKDKDGYPRRTSPVFRQALEVADLINK